MSSETPTRASKERVWPYLAALALALPPVLLCGDFYLHDIYFYSCMPEQLVALHYLMPVLVPAALICLAYSAAKPQLGYRFICAAGILIWPLASILLQGVCGHEPYGDYGYYLAGLAVLYAPVAYALPETRRRRALLPLIYAALAIPCILGLEHLYEISGIAHIFPVRG